VLVYYVMGIRITDEDRARRADWTGGVAKSFDAAEEMNDEFWMQATPEARFEAALELSWSLREGWGYVDDAGGLRTAPWGVRKR
jgi:hypothetical protein